VRNLKIPLSSHTVLRNRVSNSCLLIQPPLNIRTTRWRHVDSIFNIQSSPPSPSASTYRHILMPTIFPDGYSHLLSPFTALLPQTVSLRVSWPLYGVWLVKNDLQFDPPTFVMMPPEPTAWHVDLFRACALANVTLGKIQSLTVCTH
jgi:hypothetical protein